MMEATPKSPWGAKQVAHTSLRDIQSEQLAFELDHSSDPAFAVVDVAPALGEAAVEDADLAYALQLQQQFDLERHEFEQQEAQTRHLSPYTKVVLDTHFPPAPVRPNAPPVDMVSDDEEDSEEDFYDDDDYIPCNGHRMPKGEYIQQRLAAGEFITKHDAELTGHRNTLYLEETHPQHSLGSMEGIKLTNPVFNSMMLHAERSQKARVRNRFGKSEQATREQVVDPKTHVMLLKMMNAGVLEELNGAVSTGKESVVYHAVGADGAEYAVKIFKTSLNDFKARAKYVEGEHRFRHQLSSQNPRKLIRLWAEKEMRNLKRAERAGLRCPHGVLLKKHVLVMQFVGQDGKPALKLAEANLSNARTLLLAYQQCVDLMRRLFVDCRLVHADLSEFNLLWRKKELWVIDLAQGVEWDHPNALRFLRDDCQHVTHFFQKRGLADALSVRALFEFVTAEKAQDLAVEMSKPRTTSPEEDNVWFHAFLPQRLSQISDPVAANASVKDAFHGGLLVDESDSPTISSSEDDEEDEAPRKQHHHQPKQNAAKSKADRKAAKKQAKAAQREKRSNRNA